MAASLSILSKVVGNKVEGLFKSDEQEKVPPSEKELKVNKNRSEQAKNIQIQAKQDANFTIQINSHKISHGNTIMIGVKHEL